MNKFHVMRAGTALGALLLALLFIAAAPASAMSDHGAREKGPNVAPATAATVGFTTDHQLYAVDTDPNDRYDYLWLQYSIEATGAFEGYCYEYLQAPAGNTIYWYGVPISISASTQVQEERFSGSTFSNYGIDGPYTMYLSLQDGYGTEIASATFDSPTYYASEFEYARFIGDASEGPITSTGDAPYTGLVIEGDVEVSVAGTYSAYCWLIESNWVGQVYADGLFSLYEGTNHIQLSYSAADLQSLGNDGPWMIQFNLNDRFYLAADWRFFDSRPYLLSDFSGGVTPSSRFTEPMISYGMNLDSDKLYEDLGVDVDVEITEPGYYLVDGLLFVDIWGGVDVGYATTSIEYFEVGTHIVHLTYDSYGIASSEVNGPYHLTLWLYSYSGYWLEQLDTVSFDTSAYKASDFQPLHLDVVRVRDENHRHGRVQNIDVVLHGSEVMDANSIDPSCYLIAQSMNSVQCQGMEIRDVDHDGIDDLVVHFDASQVKGIAPSRHNLLFLVVFTPNGATAIAIKNLRV